MAGNSAQDALIMRTINTVQELAGERGKSPALRATKEQAASILSAPQSLAALQKKDKDTPAIRKKSGAVITQKSKAVTAAPTAADFNAVVEDIAAILALINDS